jgi:iron(II)-dependent oxidoreductase
VSESNETVKILSVLHKNLIDQYSSYSEQDLRTQYHPDLSQLGWHLTHVAFIEQFWLREVVLGDASRTKGLHQDFFPEFIEKSKRGNLSAIADFEQLQADFSDTEKLLSQLSSTACHHSLMNNDYLGWFLIQHAEQHKETMQMVLQQRAITAITDAVFTAQDFDAVDPDVAGLVIAAGEHEIGSNEILACDNEQPVHIVTLPEFVLASRMVNNAEYLGFMQAGGYRRQEFWSDEGWQWNRDCQHIAPEHWQQDDTGNWYSLSAQGQSDIEADSAVYGLSWHEADAFARYAGCRLPHEFEWEAAMKSDSALLLTTGQAWEWCANTFFPYKDFQAFPYQRYSSPWFDGQHYIMKGSSPFSGESVRRPSFRNFYQPDKRHVFAGLRLAKQL